MKTRVLAALAAVLTLAATPAFAEAYKLNIHMHPSFGTDLSRSGFVAGADISADIGALSIGPVAPQLEVFGFGSANNTLLNQGSVFGGAVGLRWRILNDEKGYRFMPGADTHGNWHGNLWLDAMFVFSSGPRLGFNVGLGYEVSLIDGLQMGPFAKFWWLNGSNASLSDASLLVFGLSFSLGVPRKTFDDPEGSKPAPDSPKPAVEGAKPAPQGTTPAPEGAKPLPEDAPPAPAGEKAPEGGKP